MYISQLFKFNILLLFFFVSNRNCFCPKLFGQLGSTLYGCLVDTLVTTNNFKNSLWNYERINSLTAIFEFNFD